MSRISLGVACGLVFGGLDTALICNVRLPWPGWLVGLLLGILLSLPDAIITKATVPILISGAVGGLLIGWIAGRFGR